MKKIVFVFVTFLILFSFIVCPKGITEAAKSGLLLWFYQILPTLLPCTILSNLLLSSHFFSLEKSGKRQRISMAELFIILAGLFFGFPIGSKLTTDFYRQGYLKRERAQLLCAFTNNLSPAYVSTFVLENSLKLENKTAVTFLLLYAPGYLFGIAGLLMHQGSSQPTELSNPTKLSNSTEFSDSRKKTASRFQMDMQIIDAGIISGFETLIKLCGYIVMFSIFVHIIHTLPIDNYIWKALIAGVLETTNGISYIGSLPIADGFRYLLAIAALSFGGISCIAQTGSILSQTDLSLNAYVQFKLKMTGISILLTCGYLFLISFR